MEAMTKALFETLLSGDERGVSLAAENQSIDFKGQTYTADGTKGYLTFQFSHAFPVVNAYGQALHPNVVARSHASLKHQPVNYEHHVVAYDKDRYQSDKFYGTVLDVDFPRTPHNGWRVSQDKSAAPGIKGIASFAKLARGMDTIIGKHQTGRHTYSVSMEVEYFYKDCAFAVALGSAKPAHDTPDDMVGAGWELIPWMEADDDLLATFSMKKKRIVSDWKGRNVVQMMGGLDGTVHYAGLGIVQYGAEREAEILQMAASGSDDVVAEVMKPLRTLTAGLKRFSDQATP